MKKYISLAASLALFTLSACTPSAPVSENTKPASPPASPTVNSSEKPKDAEAKTDAKPTSGDAGGWQDYSSSASKFSVQMPTKPQEKTEEQKSGVKTQMVISESSDSAYLVSYTNIPNKIADSDVQEMLNGAVKALVSGSIKGEIKSTKEVKLGEVPCLDFEATGKIEANDATTKGRVCIADNERYYQVFALGASAKFSDSDFDRFIKSFKISK